MMVHFDCHQYTIKVPTKVHKNKTLERIFRRQNIKRMEKKCIKLIHLTKTEKMPSGIVTAGAYAGKEKSCRCAN